MTKQQTTAYAFVTLSGEVAVNSIHATELGAMVNALAAVAGEAAYYDWTEQDVKDAYDRVLTWRGTIKPVIIRALEH